MRLSLCTELALTVRYGLVSGLVGGGAGGYADVASSSGALWGRTGWLGYLDGWFTVVVGLVSRLVLGWIVVTNEGHRSVVEEGIGPLDGAAVLEAGQE